MYELLYLIFHFFFAVFTVPTGSMAPTIIGYHKELKCPHCGQPLVVNASKQGDRIAGFPVETVKGCSCGNCGHDITFAKEKLSPQLQGGDRILVAWAKPSAGKKEKKERKRCRATALQSVRRNDRCRNLVVLLAACALSGPAPAQGPAEKKFTVEARDKSWVQVMEWLSDVSGMTITVEHNLEGTLSIIAPKAGGKVRQYTLSEILDIVNENLVEQKGRIVRRGKFLALISTAEKIDYSRQPRLIPADLAKRGRTEPVAVVVPLKNLKGDKIADSVKRLLRPTGEVQVLANVNALLLCDNAGSVEHAIGILKELENPPPLPAARKVPGDEPLPNSSEKKYAFEFRIARWNRVLEWLSDQTGMPVVVGDTGVPRGSLATLDHISPNKGKEPALYTLPEIIDLLNEELLSRKHLLIRRTGVWQLVLASEKIDPSIVPHIGLDELPKRGKTELVSITLPLEEVGGEQGVLELRRLLGRFGEVIVFDNRQCVFIRDTAGNLRKLRAIFADEKKPAGKKSSESAAYDTLGDVRLAEIKKAGNVTEAVLLDVLTNKHTSLRESPKDVVLKMGVDDIMEIRMRIRVLRIQGRDVCFSRGRRIFMMHIGDNLRDVLARPLEPDEVRKLDLPMDR